jgi:hypothetical protein
VFIDKMPRHSVDSQTKARDTDTQHQGKKKIDFPNARLLGNILTTHHHHGSNSGSGSST